MVGSHCLVRAALIVCLQVRCNICHEIVSAGRRHPEDAEAIDCRFAVPPLFEGKSTRFEVLLGPRGFVERVHYGIRLSILKYTSLSMAPSNLYDETISHMPPTHKDLALAVRAMLPPMYLGPDEASTHLFFYVKVMDMYQGLTEDEAILCSFQANRALQPVSEQRSMELREWRTHLQHKLIALQALTGTAPWQDARTDEVQIERVDNQFRFGKVQAMARHDASKRIYKMKLGSDGPIVALKICSFARDMRAPRREVALSRVLSAQGLTPQVLANGVVFKDGTSSPSYSDARHRGEDPVETFLITEWKGVGTLDRYLAGGYKGDSGMGKVPSKADDEADAGMFRAAGALLARIHNINHSWFEEEEEGDVVEPASAHLATSKTGKRLVTSHHDFKADNVIFGVSEQGVEGLQVIDLDGAGVSYALHDLISMLMHCGKHKQAFLEGYLVDLISASGGRYFPSPVLERGQTDSRDDGKPMGEADMAMAAEVEALLHDAQRQTCGILHRALSD